MTKHRASGEPRSRPRRVLGIADSLGLARIWAVGIGTHWQNCRMGLTDVEKLLGSFEGVRRTERPGHYPEWRYHGRLVARQLDSDHLVIRTDFDFRRSLMLTDGATFSVPNRYVKHMMVVADFVSGDGIAIEDALENAWQLQRSAD